MDSVTSIDLNVSEELKDPEFAKLFFHQMARDEIAIGIRKLREKRELNQTQLARLAGMKQSAISRLEQAEYSGWSFPTLIRIADALGARLKFIIDPIEDVIREYEREEREASIDFGGDLG